MMFCTVLVMIYLNYDQFIVQLEIFFTYEREEDEIRKNIYYLSLKGFY